MNGLRFADLVRGARMSLLLNALLPWAAYQILTAQGVDTVPALVLTSVFPVAGTLIGWVRSGRPDVLGLLSVLFIALSIATALLTDNPLVLLLRRSVSNAVFAILCFGSLVVGRPLMFYAARQFVAGWDRSAIASFDAQWPDPGFQRTIRTITVAWGCWFAIQAIGRVIAVELLSISTFLAVWPIVTTGGTIAMISWSMAEGRRGQGRAVWDPAEHGTRLSEQARLALDRADAEAKQLRHRYVGTEHLLLALCDDEGLAGRTLRGVGVTPDVARTTLEVLATPGDAPAWLEIGYAPRLNAALRRADDLHRASEASEVGAEHLLVGLLDDPSNQAVNILSYIGVDLARLRARLAGPRDLPPDSQPA
jgi:hypothetical protein